VRSRSDKNDAGDDDGGRERERERESMHLDGRERERRVREDGRERKEWRERWC